MTQRILLADDSVTIRKVVELTFSDEDFRITAVGDGAQALESARAERPDVVISDVSMPGLTGYELCERIKADDALRAVPFLLLRGAFEGFDEEKAAACGADGVIVKPFEAREMVQKVKELIGAAAAAPAPRAQAIPAAAKPAVEAALPTSLPIQPPAPQRIAPAPPPARPAPPKPAPPSPAVPFGSPAASLVSPPQVSAAAPLRPPPPPPPPPAAARPAASPPPPPAPARPVAIEQPPTQFSKEDFDLGHAAPAPAPAALSDDDLWSEVNLRGGTTPIVDPAVGEDNLWGSLADASVLDEQVAPAPAAQCLSPRAEPAAAAAPPAFAAAIPAPVAPAGPTVDSALIERLVAERLDAAVRQALEPLVAGVARPLLEDVAWQVLPELAEAMIRAEIERIARGADRG